jgi:type II secretory pathway pseudopilin PulG
MTEDKNNMRIGLADPVATAPGSAGHSSLDDRGYILAVLLIGMAISAVWLTASLPAWRQQAQREKELELRFRGEQYARAIALFYVKNSTFPTDIDTLVSQHYLRKKWKDPITGDDFTPLLAGQAAPGSGSSPQNSGRSTGPGSSSAPQIQTPGRTNTAGPAGSSGQTGMTGGIVGVVSKSKATSIIVYNGQQEYDLWQFNYQAACAKFGRGCQTLQQQQQGANNGRPGAPGQQGTGPAGGRPGGTGQPPGRGGGPTGGGPVGGGLPGRGRGGV